jgi:hypothetical protein
VQMEQRSNLLHEPAELRRHAGRNTALVHRMSWTDGCPFHVRLSKTDDVRPQNPHAVRFSVNLLELRAIARDFRDWLLSRRVRK